MKYPLLKITLTVSGSGSWFILSGSYSNIFFLFSQNHTCSKTEFSDLQPPDNNTFSLGCEWPSISRIPALTFLMPDSFHKGKISP